MDPLIKQMTEIQATQREILVNQSNTQKVLEKHAELLQEQGKTLLRNTITVEEHRKMSINLDKELRRVDKRVDEVEDRVGDIKVIWKTVAVVTSILMGLGGAVVTIYEVFFKK